MKEFKASEITEKNGLVEDIDKKFDEDLKEIKQKLNAEKLSDEFKENLQAKLEEELNKTTSNTKGKIIDFPVITRKLAGICACFVVLCSSCIAFADDIENAILDIFGNTDRIIEKAIENGNYREIDMAYVESNGVSIKVDYVVIEEDGLYIAFNVLGGEEYNKIFIDDIKIRAQDDYLLYTEYMMKEKSSFTSEDCSIKAENSIIICKLTNLIYDFNALKKIKFDITNIDFIKDDIFNDQNGEWKFEINL